MCGIRACRYATWRLQPGGRKIVAHGISRVETRCPPSPGTGRKNAAGAFDAPFRAYVTTVLSPRLTPWATIFAPPELDSHPRLERSVHTRVARAELQRRTVAKLINEEVSVRR